MTMPSGLGDFARSLRGRLVLSATLFILLSMIVVGLVVGRVFERFVHGEVEARLETQISQILAALPPNRPSPAARGGREPERQRPARPDRATDDDIPFDRPGRNRDRDGGLDRPPFDRPESGWYWQVTGRDGVLMRSASLGDTVLSPAIAEAGERGKRERTPFAKSEDAGLIVRSRRVSIPGGEITVVATAPVAAVSAPLRDASLAVALPIGLCGLLLVGAIALQVRFGLAPLDRLRQSLAAVRSGERSHVEDVEAAELRPLVGELNALIEQDAANLRQARRHVANLAHGLKTPLATLSAAFERLPEAADRDDLAGSIELMDRRIRHHLRRARAAALDGRARYRTPLRPHAQDLADVVSRLHAGGALVVRVDLPGDDVVAVEPEDLDEMLGNLLDNAGRHATHLVRISAKRDDRQVVVSIEDDGKGLTDAEIEAVLQPGRRLDETSPGHGFGLPITAELAELHGGTLRLGRSALGGLLARLGLPAAPASVLSETAFRRNRAFEVADRREVDG